MSKPLVIIAGRIQQLPDAEPLDLGAWSLPVAATPSSVLSCSDTGVVEWAPQSWSTAITGPTEQYQLLQATGLDVAAWTRDILGLTKLVVDNVTLDGATITSDTGVLSVLCDLKTDYRLNSDTNTFLGVGVANVGPLTGGGANGLYNTALGHLALRDGTTCSYNTATGTYALRGITTGTMNSATGYAAALQIGSGSYNVACGAEALRDCVGINNSTAVGYAALMVSAASANVAIGFSCLRANTSGFSNVGVGTDCLRLNTEGVANVSIGRDASYNSTTASYVTTVGYEAGKRGNINQLTAIGALALSNLTSGTANSAVGFCAMRETTSGHSNLAFGHQAMRYNQTGAVNVAMGFDALRDNVSGHYNIAIGAQTLVTGTAIEGNVAIGYACCINTTANNNVGIGTNALRTNASGGGNVAIGRDAMYWNLSGSTNVGIGHSSLVSNTSGAQNVGIGYASLYRNTIGNDNLALGVTSMYFNTEGYWNSCVGSQSGYNNLTGIGNTAIGRRAMFSNVSGNWNVCIGGRSGEALLGGEHVAIGYGSFLVSTVGQGVGIGAYSSHSNVGGLENVSIGYCASQYNVSGHYNTSAGFMCLRTNTANYSTAFGRKAGYFSTGGSNVFVGGNTGYYLGAGTANVMIGTATGLGNAAGYGANYNTLIGDRAGYSLSTGGSSNTLIGNSAGYNLTTGHTNIVIGHSIHAPAATSIQTMTIGNLIYGAGVDGYSAVVSNGRVGIRVATPRTHVTTEIAAQHLVDHFASAIHLRTDQTTIGLFAGSYATQIGYITQGGYYSSGGNMRAQTDKVAGMRFNAGMIEFFTNSSLTVNTVYAPTIVAMIDGSGMHISGDLTVNGISVTNNIQIGGNDVTKVLDANKTIYVRTTGHDTNSGLTAGSAFLTPQRALNELYRWVADGYAITVDLGEGVYSLAASLSPSYAYGAQVTWQGVSQSHSSCAISGIGADTASTTGLSYIQFDVTLPAGYVTAVGQFIMVRAATGGTNPELTQGCHEVVAWDSGTRKATVRCFRRSGIAALPSGAITATRITVVKTVFNFTASNGVKLFGCYHAGTWDSIVFRGTLAYAGVWMLNGSSIYLTENTGTSTWKYNIYVQNNANIFADGSLHSHSDSSLAKLQNGGVVNLRSGPSGYPCTLSGSRTVGLTCFNSAAAAANGCNLLTAGASYGIQASKGGFVDFEAGSARHGHSTAVGIYADRGGGVDATSATNNYATTTGTATNGYII